MKIIEIGTNKVLYDSKGEEEFFVSFSFFEALKVGKIRYRAGGKEQDLRFTKIETLDIKDEKFDSAFKNTAASEMGKLAMKGEMPLNTIL